MMLSVAFTGAIIDGVNKAEILKEPSKKALDKLKATCGRLKMSQEIKDILMYLLENRETLKCSKFEVYCRSSLAAPYVYVQFPNYTLSFTRTRVKVTIEEQPSYWFVPRGIEHFKRVVELLKKLPKGIDEETRQKAVAAEEAYPEVSIEELLVFLKLKFT